MDELLAYVDDRLLGFWKLLLQEGFRVRARTGKTVGDFLRQELGLEADYVENRIRTIFLNGHPVDDIEAQVVRQGDVLGLSGALPGVVGIAMRRDSPIARMRSGISLNKAAETDQSHPVGEVSLKLFNLILGDLGPGFLARGVGVDRASALRFMQGPEAKDSLRCALWDGCREEPGETLAHLARCNADTVWLRCRADSAQP